MGERNAIPPRGPECGGTLTSFAIRLSGNPAHFAAETIVTATVVASCSPPRSLFGGNGPGFAGPEAQQQCVRQSSAVEQGQLRRTQGKSAAAVTDLDTGAIQSRSTRADCVETSRYDATATVLLCSGTC